MLQVLIGGQVKFKAELKAFKIDTSPQTPSASTRPRQVVRAAAVLGEDRFRQSKENVVGLVEWLK
jgi:hypothetical protein